MEYFPENAIRVRGLGIFSRKRDQGSKIRIFYRKRDQGSKIGNIFRKRDQGSRIGNISQKTRSGFEDWEYYPENAIRVRRLEFPRKRDQGSRIANIFAAKTPCTQVGAKPSKLHKGLVYRIASLERRRFLNSRSLIESGFEDWEYFLENAIRARGIEIFPRKRDQGSRIGNSFPKTRSGFEDSNISPKT